MKTLIITVGLPASGKTTWSKQWIAERENRVRISRDDLRQMFGLTGHDRVSEDFITKTIDVLVRRCLSKDYDVVIDSTGFVVEEENHWKTAFKDLFIYKKVFDVSLEECLKRNENRENKIDPKVIHRMHDKYIKNQTLNKYRE